MTEPTARRALCLVLITFASSVAVAVAAGLNPEAPPEMVQFEFLVSEPGPTESILGFHRLRAGSLPKPGEV